ncbi:MAG: SurA N-terminal domain-containing protein [Gammaproteobacteria bacterium]|nr:SurA N-terminal domain-containing protein [Gammaproteobacteria bacterium]
MLQKLNDRIQGAVAWIIVILVTITFTLFGLDYFLQSRNGSDVKAQVNGKIISKQEYDLNYRRMSQSQDPSTLTAGKEKALKQQVLSDMISNTVRVTAAGEQGFAVDARQATAAIVSIPQFQEDGHFSSSRYTQALSNALFTPQMFQQEVRQGMLLNQQRFALVGTAFVLPTELKQFISLSMQTRDYDYAVIKAAAFESKVQVTDKEIQDYYNAHQKDFYSKEQVSIDYIRLSLADMRKAITISPEQALHYYEENKANYLTPAQWQLAYIRFPFAAQASDADENQSKQLANDAYKAAIADPQHFDSVGQRFASNHAAQQGRLPVVVAGQSEMDAVLVNLTKPGQVSAPIRTPEGYQVVQVVSYQSALVQPFSKVATMIRAQLKQEAAQKQFATSEEKLSELSYQNPDALLPVAKALQLPMQHSDLFTRDAPDVKGIAQHNAVVQTAFSHDVLVYGNNSEPLQLDADTVIVLRVHQHLPAKRQAMAQVRSQIKQALLRQKADMAAAVYGKQLIAHPNDNALRWQAVKAAGRDAESLDPQLNALAFSISKMGDYAGHTLKNGDFAVVRLTKIEPGKLNAADKEQLATIPQQVEATYGLMDYDLYIAQLMSEAKIVHKS